MRRRRLIGPHRVGEIDWIVVAVAEEIVIAGIEQLRVFAHEPAKGRIVCAGAIFVEREGLHVVSTVGSGVFASGEQETIVVGGAIKLCPVSTVNRRRPKGIIYVSLDHLAGLTRGRAAPIE